MYNYSNYFQIHLYNFDFLSSGFALIFGFIFMSIECKPIILDAIVPINHSRPRKLEFEIECFLDREEYFVLYLLEELVGLAVSVGSVITTGTFLATMGKHFCATYKIARFIRSLIFLISNQIEQCQTVVVIA